MSSIIVSFLQLMPDNAMFLLAEHKNQVVGGSLVLYDETNVYAHLGGTEVNSSLSGITNLIDYETIKWGQKQGKLRYILGAGYKPDDGIFKYKAQFSPLRAKLMVLKKIHSPEEFATLSQLWSGYTHLPLDQTGYFPPYRSPFDAPKVSDLQYDHAKIGLSVIPVSM